MNVERGRERLGPCEDHALGGALAQSCTGTPSAASLLKLLRYGLLAHGTEAQIDLRVAEVHAFASIADRSVNGLLDGCASLNAIELRPSCFLAFLHRINHELWRGIAKNREAEAGLWQDGDVACVGLLEDGAAYVSELLDDWNRELR